MVSIFVSNESITCEANQTSGKCMILLHYPLEMFNRDSSRAFKQET
jgi:hypothetical protein